MNPETVARFFYWMRERERIRQLRARGAPAPWTTDPVLREFKFTNVMREFDAVSVWIQANITEPFEDNPNLWLMLAIARQINWPPSLHELIEAGAWPVEDFNSVAEQMVEVLDARRARGEQVYTGAYMIHADSSGEGHRWNTKNDFIVYRVIGQLDGEEPQIDSMEEFTTWLAGFYSWGGFMAYEVACDLRWAEGWLNRAPDLRTWANPGPGAFRGLNRISDRPLKGKIPVPAAIGEMRQLLALADRNDWDGLQWPRRFELRDIEHSLCEFDKYERARTGEGRPRSRFTHVIENDVLGIPRWDS